MDYTVVTMDLTGKSQRPGIRETGRPLVSHKLSHKLSCLHSQYTESRLSLSSGHIDSPYPIPLARLQNEPLLQNLKDQASQFLSAKMGKLSPKVDCPGPDRVRG